MTPLSWAFLTVALLIVIVFVHRKLTAILMAKPYSEVLVRRFFIGLGLVAGLVAVLAIVWWSE